jgi:hypothetical protein
VIGSGIDITTVAVVLVTMPSIMKQLESIDYQSPMYRYIVPNIDTSAIISA